MLKTLTNKILLMPYAYHLLSRSFCYHPKMGIQIMIFHLTVYTVLYTVRFIIVLVEFDVQLLLVFENCIQKKTVTHSHTRLLGRQ